ncbi:MAG TPA: endonuclease MutS2 [Desulfonatronum sp.]|nr:endonuclease MutS2 [Desulfonatronum sp.]
MESRTFTLLEFPKVIEALASCCRSEPGRRAASALFPARDIQEVARRQQRLRQSMTWAEESRVQCPDFPDLDGVFGYLASPARMLDLDAAWVLGRFITAARHLKGQVLASDSARWPLIRAEAETCAWPEQTAAALKRCVSDDGQLKDESSPELWSLRQDIRRIHQQCIRRVKEFVKDQGIDGYLQDDFMTISSDRYVLPLKSNFKGKVAGIIHDYSQTGETCYIEPLFLVEINNGLQERRQQEREAEARVLAYLAGLVRQESDSLQQLYGWLVDMDLLLAKARLGVLLQAQAIDVAPDAELRLKNARHPLLVLSGQQAQPMDLELKETQRVLIISGGNAGGKTVALKTTGLLALMALAGLPVPADEGSTLPLWHSVFVFMGDEQTLEGQLSTFSAQIRHLSKVWEDIDEKSLVLLDEFGAGTDPSQGAALAQAVVDGLLEKGAWTLVATHFPALKAYALGQPGVRSASVLFDPGTNKPLYRLAYDQVGASQAMEVAREYGLPEAVLARAEHYLLLDGADSQQLISRLNELAAAREVELAGAREQGRLLSEQRAKLAEEHERGKTALLADLKKQSQDILRQMREEKISRRQALRELARTRHILEQSRHRPEPEEHASWEAYHPGERVVYPAWGKSGTILERDERRKALKVDLGGVSLWLPFQDLARISEQAAVSRPAAVRNISSRPVELRLDLRGLRVDEALGRLAAHLDRAILSGVSQVDIIHGRGTGALRREVHQFLKDFPAVTSFVVANEDEGGDGVTQARMR